MQATAPAKGQMESKPPGVVGPRPTHGPRVRSWPAVVGVLVVVALGIAAILRTTQKPALPAGLIQVNGRIEGDLVTISSKYAGRIQELRAREGDDVSRGQMLVSLEDAELRARLDQAIANARLAEESASGAATGVSLTADTTNAQIVQAQGLVRQAESGVESARTDLIRASGAVATSKANARAADAAVPAAQASVEAAAAARTRAVASLRMAEADLATARATTRAADASVEAASSASERSDRDAARFQTLGKEGAVSEQTVDQANTAARSARAQLNNARAQLEAAISVEASREAGVAAAQEQVKSAQAAIRQAEAQGDAARDQASAAWSGVRQTVALREIARTGVRQANARKLQAVGQLQQANTAPDQVAVSRSSHEQARAKIAQAKAAVRELNNTLDSMRVRAPVSGTVTTRFRDVGEVVAAGTPLLEVVDLNKLYLKVYVPEPEIGHVRLGLPARVYVDSFPDRFFEATVTYISSAAEFTPKEVQTPDERVKLVYAVKLTLKSNPDHRLTPGMPADAIIQWKPEVDWQRPRW